MRELIMSRVFIGIDPGSKGFIAVNYGEGYYDFLPLTGNSYNDIAEYLQNISRLHGGNVVCCMEEIHAVYGSSAKATFSFGEIFGALQGILAASNIPYHLVSPKVWQKEIWIPQDKIYKNGLNSKGELSRLVDNKPTSIKAAKRLFPGVDFRRTEKCLKVDDNKCDAMLICEYGRRKNL